MEKCFTITVEELLDVVRQHFAEKYSLNPSNVEIIAPELDKLLEDEDFLPKEILKVRLNPIILDDFSNVGEERFASLGTRLSSAMGKVTSNFDGFPVFNQYRQLVEECYKLWTNLTMNYNTFKKIHEIMDHLKIGVIPNLKIDIKNDPKLNQVVFFGSEWDKMLINM